jgi:hypothetical protein
VPSGITPVGAAVTVSIQAPGIDLSGARIVWEARDQDPCMGKTFTFSPKNNGEQWVEAEAQLPDGRRVFATATFNADSPNTVWVDDALPTGAAPGSDGGDAWTWVSSPTPVSGSLVQQSTVAAGQHQHFFDWASATLTVPTNGVLYAYVYLDPANPPSEVMLEWNNGDWNHIAYWGANNINFGTDGTPSRRYMGPLPAAGQWVQLKVPASQVALEGSVVKGMGFCLYNGRAWWDAAGLLNPNVGTNNTSTNSVVTITTKDASRAGPVSGSFTFTRTGSTNAALAIDFTLSGTATNGVDYSVPALPSQTSLIASSAVTIPAGATSTTLNITPKPAAGITDDRTVVLTPASNAKYSVAAPGSASLVIGGNTVNSPIVKMTAGGPKLSWSGTNGAVYRVAYKNDLKDPTWTLMGTDITASSTNTAWTDPEKRMQRFYRVIQVR